MNISVPMTSISLQEEFDKKIQENYKLLESEVVCLNEGGIVKTRDNVNDLNLIPFILKYFSSIMYEDCSLLAEILRKNDCILQVYYANLSEVDNNMCTSNSFSILQYTNSETGRGILSKRSVTLNIFKAIKAENNDNIVDYEVFSFRDFAKLASALMLGNYKVTSDNNSNKFRNDHIVAFSNKSFGTLKFRASTGSHQTFFKISKSYGNTVECVPLNNLTKKYNSYKLFEFLVGMLIKNNCSNMSYELLCNDYEGDETALTNGIKVFYEPAKKCAESILNEIFKNSDISDRPAYLQKYKLCHSLSKNKFTVKKIDLLKDLHPSYSDPSDIFLIQEGLWTVDDNGNNIVDFTKIENEIDLLNVSLKGLHGSAYNTVKSSYKASKIIISGVLNTSFSYYSNPSTDKCFNYLNNIYYNSNSILTLSSLNIKIIDSKNNKTDLYDLSGNGELIFRKQCNNSIETYIRDGSFQCGKVSSFVKNKFLSDNKNNVASSDDVVKYLFAYCNKYIPNKGLIGKKDINISGTVTFDSSTYTIQTDLQNEWAIVQHRIIDLVVNALKLGGTPHYISYQTTAAIK